MPTSAQPGTEKSFPSPPPPTTFVRWLLFLQVPMCGQRQLPIALPCPSWLFPALQLHRPWSSRRWPPSCCRQPFWSLSLAGCAEGCAPAPSQPCDKAVCARMDLEIISVTGWMAVAERRHFWLTGSLSCPMEGGRRGKVSGWLHIVKKPGHSVPRALLPPEPLPCAPGALRVTGSLASRPQPGQGASPRVGWGPASGGPTPQPRCRIPAPEQPQRPSSLGAPLRAGKGVVRGCMGTCCRTRHRNQQQDWGTKIFSVLRTASNTHFHPLFSSRAVFASEDWNLLWCICSVVTQQFPRVSSFYHWN